MDVSCLINLIAQKWNQVDFKIFKLVLGIESSSLSCKRLDNIRSSTSKKLHSKMNGII